MGNSFAEKLKNGLPFIRKHGDEEEELSPESLAEEKVRLEKKFSGDLSEAVLAKVGLDWFDFDIDNFIALLDFLDNSELRPLCQTASAFLDDKKEGGKRFSREAEAAFYNSDYKKKSDIIDSVLMVLDTELDSIDIDGFQAALIIACHSSDFDFKKYCYKEKEIVQEETENKDVEPRVLALHSNMLPIITKLLSGPNNIDNNMRNDTYRPRRNVVRGKHVRDERGREVPDRFIPDEEDYRDNNYYNTVRANRLNREAPRGHDEFDDFAIERNNSFVDDANMEMLLADADADFVPDNRSEYRGSEQQVKTKNRERRAYDESQKREYEEHRFNNKDREIEREDRGSESVKKKNEYDETRTSRISDKDVTEGRENERVEKNRTFEHDEMLDINGSDETVRTERVETAFAQDSERLQKEQPDDDYFDEYEDSEQLPLLDLDEALAVVEDIQNNFEEDEQAQDDESEIEEIEQDVVTKEGTAAVRLSDDDKQDDSDNESSGSENIVGVVVDRIG